LNKYSATQQPKKGIVHLSLLNSTWHTWIKTKLGSIPRCKWLHGDIEQSLIKNAWRYQTMKHFSGWVRSNKITKKIMHIDQWGNKYFIDGVQK
jgi:hypothetical protein